MKTKTSKKVLSAILAFVMIMCTGVVSFSSFATDKVGDETIVKLASAEESELNPTGQCGDNVYWTFDKSTGLLTIKGSGDMYYYYRDSPFSHNPLIKTVVIDSGVTSTGTYAFEYCTGLTNITIPDSVKSIGYDAFYKCTSLTSVTIPDSVTSIGSLAFSGCTGLTSITIPDSVTSIGEYAFSNTGYYNNEDNWENGVLYIGNHLIEAKDDIFSSYSIKNGTKSIANCAFSSCDGLESITIPNSVTSIGEWAFCDCTGLTSITIPDSVTSIGDLAFWGCTGLTSITIPDSVTSIGDYAFEDCTGLTSIVVDKNNAVYDSRDNCNAIIETSTNELIQGCNNTIIPTSVTSIGDLAFWGCTGLTSIIIPDSVTSIGVGAFSGCTGLTSIVVDKNNAVYDSRDNCNAIIKTSTNELVQGCKNTVIPTSVTSIGDAAFYVTGLTSVTIPNSVTSIGKEAFGFCIGLTSITIPDSVTSIGLNAFIDTGYYINDNNWDNGVLYIGNCLIEAKTTISDDYVVKSGTKIIADYAFRGCTGLTSITLPDSVTSIGDWAFTDCTGIKSITISYSVTSIGANAFSGCDGLESIIIPNSVTSIGYGAFSSCTGLTSITLPDSVTNIGFGLFNGCTGLTNIVVDKNNAVYDSRDNCNAIIKTSTNELVQGCRNTVIPNSVTSIGWDAFCDCTDLTSIIIPDSVTSIGDYAFSYCTELTSITIPDSVTSIGKYAFEYCTGLTSIEIGNSVTSIGDAAFYRCTGLTDVYYTGTEAEWNAIDIKDGNKCLTNATIHFNSKPDTDEPITIENNDAGVQVECPNNSFDNNVDVAKIQLNVEKTSADAEVDRIVNEYSLTRIPDIDVYNISLTYNGEEIQPNGKVTVRIPYSGTINDISKVKIFHYYNDKNNELVAERITGVKLINGYLEFETNHFSKFIAIKEDEQPQPSTISIAGTSLNYKSGTTLTTDVNYNGEGNYTVKYTSSNPNVVSVDDNGYVYGANKGTATITAELQDASGNTVASDSTTVSVSYTWWQWLIKIVLFGWLWY